MWPQIPDFLNLDLQLEKVKSVLVVGGGFLGTELAVGMATRCEQHSSQDINLSISLQIGKKG